MMRRRAPSQSIKNTLNGGIELWILEVKNAHKLFSIHTYLGIFFFHNCVKLTVRAKLLDGSLQNSMQIFYYFYKGHKVEIWYNIPNSIAELYITWLISSF